LGRDNYEYAKVRDVEMPAGDPSIFHANFIHMISKGTRMLNHTIQFMIIFLCGNILASLLTVMIITIYIMCLMLIV